MTAKSNVKPVTKTDLEKFQHITESINAEKVLSWLRTRGGIAIWSSINLSNLGKTWTTPALKENGEPTDRPSWQVSREPVIITDAGKVGVSVDQEVKRFHVGVRRGAQGMTYKVTDASGRRIRREIEKAGVGAFYEFDYSEQSCVILKPDRIIGILEYQSEQSVS